MNQFTNQAFHSIQYLFMPAKEKLCYNFAELPKPSLGDLSDLKTLSVRHRRENNPNVLGYNYDELVSLDTVECDLVPEKKGIILKHNEYHVSSKVITIFNFAGISAKHHTLCLDKVFD